MAAPAFLRWTAAQFAVVGAAAWLLALWDQPQAERLLPTLVVVAAFLFAFLVGPSRDTPPRKLPRGVLWGLVGGAVVAAWALRVWANRGHPLPLGYDYGFYKATFDLHEGQVPLDRAPTWSQLQFEPGLPALHSVLHAVAGLDAATHLLHLLPFLAAALAVPAFAAARDRFGDTAGVMAAWLTALSATQFEAFAYLYEKNLLALGLLAILLLAVRREAWIASGVLIGALAIWHRPTFLLAALASPVAFVPHLRTSWRRLAIAAAVAALIALPVWIALADTFFATGSTVAMQASEASPSAPASTGTFFPLAEYLQRAAPYAPLALAAIVLAWTRPAARVPAALVATAFLYVVLRFPLHLRFIVMLDAAAVLVVFAALAGLLEGTRPRVVAVVAALVVAAAAVPTLMEASSPTTAHRYVSPEQVAGIAALRDLPPDAVLVADNLRAPYVAADSGHRTFGPGLFDDPHDRRAWQAFWSTGLNDTAARAFFAVYGDEVYVVQASEPGPDWGTPTLKEPTFEVARQSPGLVVWRLVPEAAS